MYMCTYSMYTSLNRCHSQWNLSYPIPSCLCRSDIYIYIYSYPIPSCLCRSDIYIYIAILSHPACVGVIYFSVARKSQSTSYHMPQGGCMIHAILSLSHLALPHPQPAPHVSLDIYTVLLLQHLLPLFYISCAPPPPSEPHTLHSLPARVWPLSVVLNSM